MKEEVFGGRSRRDFAGERGRGNDRFANDRPRREFREERFSNERPRRTPSEFRRKFHD